MRKRASEPVSDTADLSESTTRFRKALKGSEHSDTGSVSSEAESQATRLKNKKRAVQQLVLDVDAFAGFDRAVFEQAQRNPDVKSLTDILKAHPDLFDSQDVAPFARVSATNVPAAPAAPTPFEIKAQAFRTQLFEDYLRKLPLPAFSIQKPHETIAEELRQKRLVLPCFDASHDNALLRQGGRFPHPTDARRVLEYPMCMYGDKCVAMHTGLHGFPGNKHGAASEAVTGCVLMGIMTPDEWDTFLVSGTAPLVARPCVLCCRYHLPAMIYASRAKQVPIDPNCVFQLYRNKADCPGGYFHQYMCTPSPHRWEGFVDNICMFRHHLLRVYRDARTRQWRIDQTALIWAPPTAVEPTMGESCANFLRRSKAYRVALAERAVRDAELIRVRLRCADPREASLLRSVQDATRKLGGLQQLRVSYLTFYDTLRTAKPGSIDPFVTYSISIVLDSLPENDLSRVACHLTVPELFNCLPDCCWWSSTYSRSQDEHALLKLLSKAVPQRCATRKFDSGVQRAMLADQTVESQLQSLLLCALLGNYPHTPHHMRPPAEARKPMYDYVFVSRVLEICPLVIIMAMRDYMTYAIPDNPALLKEVSALFDWGEFCSEVQVHMSVIREVFVKHLALSRGAYHETADFAADIQRALKDAHKAILRLCYQRPCKAIVDEFHTLKYDTTKITTIAPVTPLHKLQIQKWVQKLDVFTHTVQADILPHFARFFGVSDASVTALHRLQRSKEVYRFGRSLLKENLTRIMQRHPYTYALMLEACAAWKERAQFYIVPLAHHHRESQVRALQERYKGCVPTDRTDFWYCPVCLCIYSFVSGLGGNSNKDYGYAGLVYDYNTNASYCITHHGVATGLLNNAAPVTSGKPDTPLARVNLLGHILFMRQRGYLLCGQEGCGMAMVLDPEHLAYNERGYACHSCSQRLFKEACVPAQCSVTLPTPSCVAPRCRFNSPQSQCNCVLPPVYCAVCDVRIHAHCKSYLYGPVVVCAAHHNEELRDSINDHRVYLPGEMTLLLRQWHETKRASRAVANGKRMAVLPHRPRANSSWRPKHSSTIKPMIE